MAYPIVNAPYGLKPINLIGGQLFAGSTRNLPIASGYAANIFYGDIVTLTSAGTIAVSALAADASPLAGTIGVSWVVLTPTHPQTRRFLHNTGLPVLWLLTLWLSFAMTPTPCLKQ